MPPVTLQRADNARWHAGVRYQIGRFVTAKLDYGWQLTDTGLRDPESSRGELPVTISY